MSVARFVDEARMNAAHFSPPVRSLLDIDFYKFLMGQVICRHRRNVRVTFELIIRDRDIPVGNMISEDDLRNALDHVRGLSLSRTDIYYLRGMDLYGGDLFGGDYLDFLKTLKLPPYKLVRKGSLLELSFSGDWAEVTMWETIALAIISELYYRAVMKGMSKHDLELVYARAMDKVSRKLERIKHYPGIRFADFGQRRRHSFLWQEWVIGLAVEKLGSQFVGTSNTWMAFHHDLVPIGTNAHELPMVFTALAPDLEKVDAQYDVLNFWEQTYGEGLRVFLPDTYGTAQFLEHAPLSVAGWRGMRQDSGDPIVQSRLYLDWLRKHNVDPKTKLVIPSDGLDVGSMVGIDAALGVETNLSFGWGSLFTNDFRDCHESPFLRPFSMVCKVVEANGKPCVKLSDNIQKATGPKDEIERYAKLFATGERVSQTVVV